MKPRLGVVLGGGATLGAFEVGVISVIARRGIVPDLLVGTSVGAINAAFWALDPDPGVGERLLEFWLRCDRSTMFPDGAVPMVGRLLQRKDHLTTQQGLARALQLAIRADVTFADTAIPLALTATVAAHGRRMVLRGGRLLPAILASSAIPGLWPAVQIDGIRLVDGGLVANCDLQSAVESGMTDVLAVDVMGDHLGDESLDIESILERTAGVVLRRQTELEAEAYGRGIRVAILRRNSAPQPRFGDFGLTRQLYRDGQAAAEAFVSAHLGPRRSVKPGIFEWLGAHKVRRAASAPHMVTA